MTTTDGAVQLRSPQLEEREIPSHGWYDTLATSRQAQRLHEFFELQCDETPGAPAVVWGSERLTYHELDARANQLAQYLIHLSVRTGDKVGILLERSLDTYVAMLGVLKAGSAFVPIDPSFPADRVAFIAEDSGLSLLLSTSAFRCAVTDLACPTLELDSAAVELSGQPDRRPETVEAGDPLCYVIYTSGSTGRPKGVAITQSNICNYLRVVLPIYGVAASDRVYQGMTLAFDFAIEEIWVTWSVGAVLIPAPAASQRVGAGLIDFLIEQEATVLCCVPTLLATLDRDVPSIRTLIVGGEPCPLDLVQRWHRTGRRMFNTYGPTETTITATWAELAPDRPVTIGRPLPTYSVHLLDDRLRPASPGGSGEICIGGPGVALGYLNRPELTLDRFVPDPFAGDRTARLYRTGDLGRFTPSGEIEYLGRIDTQVKIRGYRIELGEIETLIREDTAVENSVVSTLAADGGIQDLVAYVTLRKPGEARPHLRERLHATLRRRLPAYMVPAFIEILEALPTLAGTKLDRSSLPAPTSPRLGGSAAPHVAPSSQLEANMARVWGRVLGQDRVSVEDDFFCNLGGHSLAAATVISQLRLDPALRWLAVADLYAHPTIRSLARQIEEGAAEPALAPACTASSLPVHRQSSFRLVCCGVEQLAALYVILLVLCVPVGWLTGAQGPPTLLLRACAAMAWVSAARLLLPIAGSRLLLARIRPGRYPLWGSIYLRWWLCRKLLGLAPLGLLAGSPFMSPYLRLLGARVGGGCHIATPKLGLPRLVQIGDGVSIGYGADLQPFFIEDGWLTLGCVRIGSGATIGTNAVVVAGAQVGRNAHVCEQSLVAQAQVIPEGEQWAGSPATRRFGADPLLDVMTTRKVQLQRWSPLMIAGFACGLISLELLPSVAAAPGLLVVAWVYAQGGLLWSIGATVLAGPLLVLTTCTLVAVGKRLAMPVARQGIFPLRSTFGLRKWLVDQLMATSLFLTNTLYGTLYALPWLRLLGARVGARAEVSTVAHIQPDLLVLGAGSFVADMAAVGPAVFCNHLFAIGPTELGTRSFVGNGAVIQNYARLGENSLIGVHSVPPTRPVDPDTSWLGSPAMFLPRRQLSDGFAEDTTYHPRPGLVAWRLAIEYVRVTLPATLLSLAALLLTVVTLRLATVLPPLALIAAAGALALAGGIVATLIVVLLKWLVIGRYRPRVEPLWSLFVRRTELITGLYEAVAVPALISWSTGTPWIGPLLRLFGAQIGRRVFLDSTYLSEFDLVEVGDDAAVGAGTSLQTHLFEDRVMKMSTVRIGHGSTVGSRSVVLYDAELRAGASLDALSLAMKGETLPAGCRWRGIPARAS